MVRWTCVLGGLGILAAAISGCGPAGPKLHPTTGTVLYKGQPVAGAVVSFRCESPASIATGTTDGQGRFELTTYQAGKGAAAAKHKVTVTKAPPPPAPAGAAMSMDEAVKAPAPAAAAPKNELPAKYADPARPVLEYEVVAGKTNDFKIELTD